MRERRRPPKKRRVHGKPREHIFFYEVRTTIPAGFETLAGLAVCIQDLFSGRKTPAAVTTWRVCGHNATVPLP